MNLLQKIYISKNIKYRLNYLQIILFKMHENLFTVSILIVVIMLYAAYCIQESSKKCDYVFRYPDTSLITDWIPGLSELAENKNENMDPINDRINNRTITIPFSKSLEGMGDITGGLWQSVKSEAMVSNDGMLTYDAGAYEQMTPEYLNQDAAARNELIVAGGLKSRVGSTMYEGPNDETPWGP